MKRTYLALAGLALAGSALPAAQAPLVRAAGLFEGSPLDAAGFAILARPVGDDDWNLVVLEQIRPRPLCWQQRPDGLIDPSLNRFDYTGICGRYLDSNGYSLRIGDEDQSVRYRLRLEQLGSELQLQASSVDESAVLVVGRGQVPLRDRDGFVALRLEPGWNLQRRVFGRQVLSHVYFANASPLAQLLAAANGGRRDPATDVALSTRLPVAAPPLPVPGRRSRTSLSRIEPVPPVGLPEGTEIAQEPSGRAVPIQVIPFRE